MKRRGEKGEREKGRKGEGEKESRGKRNLLRRFVSSSLFLLFSPSSFIGFVRVVRVMKPIRRR